MVTTAAVLAVGTVALGMVLTPGPNMLYLVSRTLTQGRSAGLISLCGVAAGFGCYLLASAAGLTAVFAVVPGLYGLVKILGALYLGWLAWQAMKPHGRSPFQPGRLSVDSRSRLFLMGWVTNLLNPKIAVMYVALIPQFLDLSSGRLWLQSLILGGVQIGVALMVNGAIVLAAGRIARFLAKRPRWLRAQRWLMGAVLGVLAVSMLVDDAEPPTSANFDD
jgi:threonine/homoserine/homoserine lactone efflux protein